jgi:hypothetical protein
VAAESPRRSPPRLTHRSSMKNPNPAVTTHVTSAAIDTCPPSSHGNLYRMMHSTLDLRRF